MVNLLNIYSYSYSSIFIVDLCSIFSIQIALFIMEALSLSKRIRYVTNVQLSLIFQVLIAAAVVTKGGKGTLSFSKSLAFGK